MGRPAGWITTLTGRTAMRSPGRPPIRRGVEWKFWVRIAEGMSSEEAGIACGVSGVVGSRWFREGGGMPTLRLGPDSGRYLSFAEREEIALLRAQAAGVREIARQLGRSPSTISRGLRRNAATCGARLDHRASIAQWKAELAARRSKTPARRRRLRCHALTAVGWDGPLNYDNDTAKFSAIVTSWEQRFGVRVVAVGPATLHLCVAAPPTSTEGALRVAAEHFAFCPDNIWQGHRSNTLSAYAERLVNTTAGTSGGTDRQPLMQSRTWATPACSLAAGRPPTHDLA